MARIRTIKPEFFTSEDIVALSPFARLLYIAMWCEADREGRLSWKPKTFKMRYFPADDVNIDELCAEITVGGLVKLYSDGLAYIPSFLRHQHVNPRESKSELPDPESIISRVVDASSRDSDVQVGREGKERKVHASLTHDFETFWTAYPKKKNKGQAEKVFAKVKPDSELLQTILNAVEGAAQGADWLKSEGQYIPYPATWLAAKGWEDGSAGGGMKPWET